MTEPANLKIDSVQAIIDQSEGIDKFEPMVALFDLYYPKQIPLAKQLSLDLITLAEEKGTDDQLLRAWIKKGGLFVYEAKFDSLRILALKGIELAEKNNNKLALYSFYNSLGIHQENRGSLDSCIYFYRKAHDLAEREEDKLSIYNNLGKIHYRMGDHNKALEFLSKAIEGARKLGLTNKEAIMSNNIGSIYLHLDNTKIAEEYFLKSIALKDEIGDERGKLFAYTGLAELDEAENREKYIADAKNIALEINDPIFILFFSVYQAEILLDAGKIQEGLDLIQPLYNPEQRLPNVLKHKLLNILGKLLFEDGQLDEAEEYTLKNLQKSMADNTPDYIHNDRGLLLKIYEAKNAYKDYFDIAVPYLARRDSMDRKVKLDELAALEAQLDEEQKKKVELLNLTVKQKEASRIRLGIIGLLSVLLLLVIIYYRNQRIKTQKKAIIKEKETASKLEELDKIKTRLYTNITHEFRTPLTVISGIAGQLNGNEKEKRLIGQNSDQLLDLVNQMLDLSKLESEDMPLVLKQADIVKYISYLAESFDSYSASINVQVHLKPEIEKLMMDFDQEKITRVVSNLLSNALKFTPAGGNVYIEMGNEQAPLTSRLKGANCFSLTVKDTGKGIPADELSHIFERFYQVDNSSTRKGEGTGIGLTLVNELIKTMGGEIHVTSEVGKGTSFTVLLPITNNAPVEAELLTDVNIFVPQKTAKLVFPSADNVADSDEVLTTEKPTVLIVEDNPHVVHYLIKCLESSYNIDVAMDGQEGIDKAINNIPDIIISDVMMPIKDGFEVCQTLKTDERTSHIPIVMLTAKADIESRLTGLQRGADAYLSKPFNQEELLINLQNLLTLRKKLQAKYAQVVITSEEDKTLDSSSEEGAKEAMAIEHAFLKKIRTLVEEDLGNADFGSLELCKGLNMSRSQIYKKVKALTGGSPSKYIRSIRLYHAREMLKTEDLNISEVAYAVGFTSPAYFSTRFVEEFGVRPNEARGR